MVSTTHGNSFYDIYCEGVKHFIEHWEMETSYKKHVWNSIAIQWVGIYLPNAYISLFVCAYEINMWAIIYIV